jgi:hypothetical protein
MSPFLAPGIDFAAIEQKALAKFTGKLRKGSASLGVTMGSWGQSSSMIKARLGQTAKVLSNTYASLVKDKKRLRKIRQQKDPLASLVLETEFGWRPLLQDLSSAVGVIAGNTLPIATIKGVHQVDQKFMSYYPPVKVGFDGRQIDSETYSGVARVTVAARCSVSNPNAFLLNHLGLLNPAEVAWDLIPWSFVVGAFVNVGAMIRSMTSEVGLNLTNKSVTRSCKTTYGLSQRYLYWIPGIGKNYHITVASSTKAMDHRYRNRTVGSLPAVKWQVQVPSLDKEGMLIVASLVLQRFNRINRLIAI